MRHGLSLGELARATNEAEGIGADLTVLPVEGWQRAQWWDETGLPWVGPSPNLPTLDTATVYPGTCLLEGTLLRGGGRRAPSRWWGRRGSSPTAGRGP